MMIRINVNAFYKLQGDQNETDFARQLKISRPHLWRIKKGASVGSSFITNFKGVYPYLKFEDYFNIE
jgi:hypothetical protein